MVEERKHSLSPSAWNRYETCPRMYWLSRQGLPRKAGMAASLGTAVHASIEDLLQIELTGRPPAESNWLLGEADVLLRKRWEEEKQIFHDTPQAIRTGKKTSTARRKNSKKVRLTCCSSTLVFRDWPTIVLRLHCGRKFNRLSLQLRVNW